MDSHQKNLDAFVNAHKVVADGYKAMITQQMEVFQAGLNKIANDSQEQATGYANATFKESTAHMQYLLSTASKAHQDAFTILSDRAKALASEIN